jgi:hypothetical protein
MNSGHVKSMDNYKTEDLDDLAPAPRSYDIPEIVFYNSDLQETFDLYRQHQNVGLTSSFSSSPSI